MRYLITGGHGQVAHALQDHTRASAFDLIVLDKTQFNLQDNDQINAQLKQYQPDCVINTAAYTLVDLAETEREKARAVNVTGTRALSLACHLHQIPLIHFSTDYVFDGQSALPYDETAPIHPLSYYGQSKWESEVAVRETCPHHIILRICGVFSARGQNFVKSILNAAKTRDRLQVVSDQITCPTAAHDIAGAVWIIVEKLLLNSTLPRADFPWGTYHFCTQPAVTWYEFAKTLCHEAAQQGLIKPIPIDPIDTATLARPAKRPASVVFDCEKIKKVFGITQPHWQESLKTMIARLAKHPE